MYVTAEEWRKELVKWMEDFPTIDNDKFFMVFDGKPTIESFMFDGSMIHFGEMFFHATEWKEVVAWAEKQGYTLTTEEDAEYGAMADLIDSHFTEVNEDDVYSVERIKRQKFDDGE